MAKLESSFKNMLISLFGVTFIASASLGLVNDITKTPIAEAEKAKKNNAIAAVLPGFDHLGETEKILPENCKDSLEIYPGVDKEGQVVGNAIKSYSYKGFSGYIEVMVGFDHEGTISGYKVLKHSETPGLGSKMGTWFSDIQKQNQTIIGKNPSKQNLTVSKDGGDIDGITAATITSRAFLESVNLAYNSLNKIYDGTTSATSQKGGQK
ncbi:MAG: RnfABCDGE type electron transport complex subunit G [Prolixibacteraceae bacterium]|nr:RnfABCDGE type electron transport complex subunit G [Prolixibacteraceae bacterium]